jgi:hypothetical protein
VPGAHRTSAVEHRAQPHPAPRTRPQHVHPQSRSVGVFDRRSPDPVLADRRHSIPPLLFGFGNRRGSVVGPRRDDSPRRPWTVAPSVAAPRLRLLRHPSIC